MTPTFEFALREDLKEEKQFLPRQATGTDTGYDVKAAMPDRKPLIIRPFEYAKIPLGYRCFIPDGWWYQLKPRSSSFTKKSLHALYGTVDQDFGMEAMMCVQYIPEVSPSLMRTNEPLNSDFGAENLVIQWGEAIGQIIPVRREEMMVEAISNERIEALFAERNSARKGGFGSSDRKDGDK